MLIENIHKNCEVKREGPIEMNVNQDLEEGQRKNVGARQGSGIES